MGDATRHDIGAVTQGQRWAPAAPSRCARQARRQNGTERPSTNGRHLNERAANNAFPTHRLVLKAWDRLFVAWGGTTSLTTAIQPGGQVVIGSASAARGPTGCGQEPRWRCGLQAHGQEWLRGICLQADGNRGGYRIRPSGVRRTLSLQASALLLRAQQVFVPTPNPVPLYLSA